MTKLKKGDFVELDFVGRIKSTGRIFDLTVRDVAEKEGLAEGREFAPMTACVGSGQLIQGFDEQIVGRETGKEFEFDLPAEKAFGKKNPKLIQLTSLSLLKKRDINPYPGMQLNIDGALAAIRSVSGGRVVIDFNHPLAGKELHYWVRINKILTDTKQKVDAVIDILRIPCKAEVKGKEATLKFEKEIPKQAKDFISAEFKRYLPDVKLEL